MWSKKVWSDFSIWTTDKKKKCNFFVKKMLTNEMWFVIINELSQQVITNHFKTKQNKKKKLLTGADDYDNISELLKTNKEHW